SYALLNGIGPRPFGPAAGPRLDRRDAGVAGHRPFCPHRSGIKFGCGRASPGRAPSPEGGDLGVGGEKARYERAILPPLDAAYNLARWLTRNDHDAEDVVQEACLRAHQFFGGFHGADGRSWLLTVVRNTCYTWLERNRPRTPVVVFDEHK